MNDLIYVVRNRKNTAKIQELIRQFQPVLCYEGARETILKNEDLIIARKKGYFLIDVLSEQASFISAVRRILRE